ncbi:MAG: hypothetical protein AB7O24_02625, partial [Kofleriaceae bacterium]
RLLDAAWQRRVTLIDDPSLERKDNMARESYDSRSLDIEVPTTSPIALAWGAGDLMTGLVQIDNILRSIAGASVSRSTTAADPSNMRFKLQFPQRLSVVVLAEKLQQANPWIVTHLNPLAAQPGATTDDVKLIAKADGWLVDFDTAQSQLGDDAYVVDRCGTATELGASPASSCPIELGSDAIMLALQLQMWQEAFYVPCANCDARTLREQLDGDLAEEMRNVVSRARAVDPKFSEIHALEYFDPNGLTIEVTPLAAASWANGHLASGIAALDQLLSDLQLIKVTPVSGIENTFTLEFAAPLSMGIVVPKLLDIFGVLDISLGSRFDGDDILIERVPEGWVVTFVKGIGDCVAGCLSHETIGRVRVTECGVTLLTQAE